MIAASFPKARHPLPPHILRSESRCLGSQPVLPVGSRRAHSLPQGFNSSTWAPFKHPVNFRLRNYATPTSMMAVTAVPLDGIQFP